MRLNIIFHMAMKYLKRGNYKEMKIRLLTSLYEKLKELSIIKGKSINNLINSIIEEYLKEEAKSTNNLTPQETPNVVFNDGKIKLLHNDFLKVNLEDVKGKVNLIVTSPPYNVGIEYGEINDNISYKDYLHFTEDYLKKFYEILADDGRICLNIPLDKNKGGIQSVYADIVTIAKKVGLKYQSTIVWNEQNLSRRTAWGSWLSASAPYVIAPVEMIVLLYKKQWKRKNKGTTTITKEEFIKWTNGVWTFPGENRRSVKHPAPFPIELPLRCIKLFSYKEDIIMDPFVGSGTTMVACKILGRKGIGIDINKNYLEFAKNRLKNTITNIF